MLERSSRGKPQRAVQEMSIPEDPLKESSMFSLQRDIPARQLWIVTLLFFHRQRASVKTDWHLKMPAILLILQCKKCFLGLCMWNTGQRTEGMLTQPSSLPQILDSFKSYFFKIVLIVKLPTKWEIHWGRWRHPVPVRVTAVWIQALLCSVLWLISFCLDQSPFCRN